MKKSSLFIGLALCCTQLVFADEMQQAAPDFTSYDGFFIGVGGSYNSVTLTQNLSGNGVSNVYNTSGTLVAEGVAGGPATPFRDTKSTFSPDGQLGYFMHLGNSPWFLGGKFFYQYIGLSFTREPVDAFQAGTFTTVSGSNTFIGNALIQSSQVVVNHELALMPIVGRSFNNTYAYLGAGAVLFQATSYQYNFLGFADINGTHEDITGQPTTFTNSQWLWGGGGQIGVTHYLDPNWYLDFGYSYLVTSTSAFHDTGAFSSTTINSGTTYNNIGVAYIDAQYRIVAQAFTIALNFQF